MNDPELLRIILGIAVIVAFWIAANQLVEMGRRWIHWRNLLRAHHAPRNGLRLPVPAAERRTRQSRGTV